MINYISTLGHANFCSLGVLYMLSYIDRGNVGNAYTAGMGEKWGITSNQYSWIITAYYLAYIAFHWFILLWKLVSLPVCNSFCLNILATNVNSCGLP